MSGRWRAAEPREGRNPDLYPIYVILFYRLSFRC